MICELKSRAVGNPGKAARGLGATSVEPRARQGKFVATVRRVVRLENFSCRHTSDTLSWTTISLTTLRHARPLRLRTFQMKIFFVFVMFNNWAT